MNQPFPPFGSDQPMGRVTREYHEWLHNRDLPDARAARARLRRCSEPLDALMERGAYALLRRASEAYAPREGESHPDEDLLMNLAPLLAWVEKHDEKQSLPAQLAQPRDSGGDRPRFSELRFRRLVASDATELLRELRRALQLLGGTANALWLAEAVCHWTHPTRGDSLRRRWAFEYYSHLPVAKKS